MTNKTRRGVSRRRFIADVFTAILAAMTSIFGQVETASAQTAARSAFQDATRSIQTSPAGLALIKAHEGLVLRAYDDARPRVRLAPDDIVLGTLTIGYGHTGPDVFVGQTINEAEAERLLRADLADAEQAVSRLAPPGLDQSVYDALVSFTFNAGAAALAKSTTLKRLWDGDVEGAAAALEWWVYTTIDGQKVRSAGLEKRRAAERALMLSEGE